MLRSCAGLNNLCAVTESDQLACASPIIVTQAIMRATPTILSTATHRNVWSRVQRLGEVGAYMLVMA